MEYKYAPNKNYEDFASGRVIYQRPGSPNFPVRLAVEVFMTCLELAGKLDGKAAVYDPCCGGAYLLTVLGFLCGGNIAAIHASDVSPEAAALAEDNLGLLTLPGLVRRRARLTEMYRLHGKQSHLDALASADNLAGICRPGHEAIQSNVFTADIFSQSTASLLNFTADIVITDIPYGGLTSWNGGNPSGVDSMLGSIMPALHSGSIVAVSSDKPQGISNPKFTRIRKITVGKRKIEFLCPGYPANSLK